jgi:hypothetical protein
MWLTWICKQSTILYYPQLDRVGTRACLLKFLYKILYFQLGSVRSAAPSKVRSLSQKQLDCYACSSIIWFSIILPTWKFSIKVSKIVEQNINGNYDDSLSTSSSISLLNWQIFSKKSTVVKQKYPSNHSLAMLPLSRVVTAKFWLRNGRNWWIKLLS